MVRAAEQARAANVLLRFDSDTETVHERSVGVRSHDSSGNADGAGFDVPLAMIYRLGEREPRIAPGCFIAESADVIGTVTLEPIP